MDWKSAVILVIILVFLFWAMMRLRTKKTPPKLQMVMAIISNINDDIRIIANRQTDHQSLKKFKVKNWNAYQDKLDFLSPDTVTALKESFTIMTDFNVKIDSVRQNNSSGSAPELPLETLREPLAKSRQDLAQWIQVNIKDEIWRSRGGLFGW